MSSVFPASDPRHSCNQLGGGRKRGYSLRDISITILFVNVFAVFVTNPLN